jgi:hypothetical protein
MKKDSKNLLLKFDAEKATFHFEIVGTYRLYPDKKGKITCGFCEKNGEFVFYNQKLDSICILTKIISRQPPKEVKFTLRVQEDQSIFLLNAPIFFGHIPEWWLRNNIFLGEI